MTHENGLTHTIGRLWRAVRTGLMFRICVDGSPDPSCRGAAPTLALIFEAAGIQTSYRPVTRPDDFPGYDGIGEPRQAH